MPGFPGAPGKARNAMPDLKLIALDAEDLKVVSAHLQDAVLRVADLAWLKGERRFALVVNRFDWSASSEGELVRRRTGLRFERVLAAQVMGLDVSAGDQCLELLALSFAPLSDETPEGHVTMTFAGGSGIRLHVECIEAELKDLGAAWAASRRPSHDDTGTAGGTGNKT